MVFRSDVGYGVVVVGPGKEPLEALGGQIGLDRVRIDTGPGNLECLGIDIRREHLHAGSLARARDLFQQQDRQRVGLFPGGAAGRPDPDRLVVAVARDQGRQHLFGQKREGCPIAKDAGDVDQQVLGQRPGLRCVVPQPCEVGGEIVGAG